MTSLRLYCQPVNHAAKALGCPFRGKGMSAIALLPGLGCTGGKVSCDVAESHRVCGLMFYTGPRCISPSSCNTECGRSNDHQLFLLFVLFKLLLFSFRTGKKMADTHLVLPYMSIACSLCFGQFLGLPELGQYSNAPSIYMLISIFRNSKRW